MSKFLEQTSAYVYRPDGFDSLRYSAISEIDLTESDKITWLNTYGLEYNKEFRQVIEMENLEPFLIKLLKEQDQSNKVIPMKDLLFLSVKVLREGSDELETEQMFFIASRNYVWTIQEVVGDHFQWIRDRIEDNSGIIRQKKGDYLLFLLLESIVNNYSHSFERFSDDDQFDNVSQNEVAKPDFMARLEERKRKLFSIKKSVTSLRDTLLKAENLTITDLSIAYFSELKEQAVNLMDDIDFELNKLDSTTNLIFSVQGYRMNEIMKTLTIFSVIFIPITFLAGVYGMNFQRMPELSWPNGYFYLLGLMVVVVGLSVWIMKRNKWL